MAASQSDEGLAPMDFNLSSSLDNESKVMSSKEKCLLCNNLRKTFYCKLCVKNGDFVSSVPHYPERFADKKLRWLKIKSDRDALNNKCLKLIQKKEKKINLQTEIMQCKDKIQLLKELMKEKNEVILQCSKVKDTVVEKNKAKATRLPRYKERVEKLHSFVTSSLRLEIDEKKLKLEKARTELEKVVQKNVEDLMEYIFPISKINAISRSEDEDTVCALAEATSTSYVQGKWVFMDELRYKIVAPTLPGSGDYSAYGVWVTANKNGVPDPQAETQSYNISAALCYATQLVNLLAFYLDVILPKKLSYTDFYSTELSDAKLLNKVCRLNTNIMYLCFSQGVDTSLLNPQHTLGNVLHLVKHPSLGRVNAFEVDSYLVMSLENMSAGVKDEEGSDSDDNDVFPCEWEAIPLVPVPECSPGPSPVSQHLDSQSVPGGLVTSLASIWRGWTGNR